MKRLKIWLLKRRVRKAVAIVKRIDATMTKIGMSRQVRRAYWRTIAASSEAREALLERMQSK